MNIRIIYFPVFSTGGDPVKFESLADSVRITGDGLVLRATQARVTTQKFPTAVDFFDAKWFSLYTIDSVAGLPVRVI